MFAAVAVTLASVACGVYLAAKGKHPGEPELVEALGDMPGPWWV